MITEPSTYHRQYKKGNHNNIIALYITHLHTVPECEIPMNKNKLVYKYNSTIKGSKLIFYCEDNPGELYIAQCYGNETWIPNIALITCGDRDQSIINEGKNIIIIT